MVGALLGHVDPKTTARYSHLSTEHVAQRMASHRAFGIDEEPAKAVSMDAAWAARGHKVDTD